MNSAPAVFGASRSVYPPPRVQARIVALMFALSAMNYFDRIVMSIAGPGIMKDFHISETEMGTIYSAFLLSYTLMMTPGGALADRFGGRWVLTVAGLGAALFTGLTAVCGPRGLGAYIGVIPAFLIMRLAFGICASPLYPSTGRIASAWIPPSGQARVQAIIMSGAAVGSAVAPVLFSRLIGAYGWRGAFWIAAALTTALILVWHSWVRDRPPGQSATAHPAMKPSGGSWRALLSDRHLLLLTGSYFALNYFEYIFYYWIYYYFGEIRHMGPDQSAFATTAIFITMAVMTPLGGWTSDWMTARFGPSRGARIVPISAMAASAALLYIGASGLGVLATVALLSLAVGFSMAPEGAFWSTAIHMGGKQVGAACGIMNCGGNVGGMLAPIVTPLIARRFGWTGGLSFASLIVLLGMLAWLVIEPTHCASEPVEAVPVG
jgi:ACS family glucarate transporter-like MFS transporter